MFTENSKPRQRGRPPGRTAEGESARRRLYATAISLIAERGYEAATLRDVAARAGVSVGLLYRYFPSKRSIVLALYDELSDAYARDAAHLPHGKWRDRFISALESSLRVLGPHRVTLRALVPVMVGDVEEGVFAASSGILSAPRAGRLSQRGSSMRRTRLRQRLPRPSAACCTCCTSRCSCGGCSTRVHASVPLMPSWRSSARCCRRPR